MKVINTKIPEIKIIKPTLFEDDRGFFFESFNHKMFEDAIGYKVNFVQDNHSMSYKGIIRGLHYQTKPYVQRKLVRVIKGKIFDVAVDIRKFSSTFGQWVSAILSSENKNQLWIPDGFAHGFLSLSNKTEVLYKTDNYYKSSAECSMLWNDKDIGIEWPLTKDLVLSHKDSNAKPLNKATLF